MPGRKTRMTCGIRGTPLDTRVLATGTSTHCLSVFKRFRCEQKTVQLARLHAVEVFKGELGYGPPLANFFHV